MASRFWVGGSGDLDGSSTAHIAATSNGAPGASYPGSGDTLTFDANSGGGTVTVTAAHTLQSLSMGAFTGTFDNSVGNHDFTLSAVGAFDNSGIGVRTVKLGTATYTLTHGAAQWGWGTTLNLTNTGNTGAFIVFSGPTAGNTCIFSGNGLSYGNLSFGAASGSGTCQITGANTFASLTPTAPNYLRISSSITVTNAFTWAGTSSNQIGVSSGSVGSAITVTMSAAGSTAQWCAFRDMTFTNTPVATNSFNLGNTSGITITAPSAGGGGGGYVIGS